MSHDKVIILDCGSQYTQLIARRVRELNIFCEIYPFNKIPTLGEDVKAVIISGSPFSVRDENAPTIEYGPFIGKIPLLGVCYGAQYLASREGGRVERSEQREYGKAILKIEDLEDPLFYNISQNSQVWMSHADYVLAITEGFKNIATTEENEYALFKKEQIADEAPVYAFQFHPEVTHTANGLQLLSNFLLKIAGVKADWTPNAFIEESIENLKTQIGSGKKHKDT